MMLLVKQRLKPVLFMYLIAQAALKALLGFKSL
jgi:hypothetical protein